MSKFRLIIGFLFILVLTILGYAKFSRLRVDTNTDQVTRTDNNKPNVINNNKIMSAGQEYAYVLIRGIKPVNMQLIDNSTDQSTSLDLVKNNRCVSGINGSFYDEEGKNMGWMVIDGKTISRDIKSSLFNGMIYISEEISAIDIRIPDTQVQYGMQSGPILISNGQPWTLKMARDKPARRMILGNANDGIFILSVYTADADLSGPLLVNLPQTVFDIGRLENLVIGSAVNLDGGSASAIFTPFIHLQEINHVGSWWCIKESF